MKKRKRRRRRRKKRKNKREGSRAAAGVTDGDPGGLHSEPVVDVT